MNILQNLVEGTDESAKCQVKKNRDKQKRELMLVKFLPINNLRRSMCEVKN